MPPEKHALLSASSAHRWLNCTAAPRFEEQFPDSTSEYAEEGSLAHAICELKVVKKFTTQISPKTFTTRLNKLRKDPRYSDEMERTSDLYIEHLVERAMSYDSTPSVMAEVRVDFSEYVPDGFGTCDCIMIGGDTLDIVDYKHGKGVAVSAEGNPQMRLYALGALKRYRPIFGDHIKTIRMTIDQPRIQDAPSTESISAADLLEWGEGIKSIAAKAYAGLGEFVPGEHCRFCKGRAQCRARADKHTALEEFKNCALPNEPDAPNKLTLEEIGDLLTRGKDLVAWYEHLQDFALNAILHGEQIPGYKVVAGRSIRAFADTDAAFAAVMAAGYDKSLLYEYKPKTLTEIEKLMGKADFAEKMAGYVVKPQGKPTLVVETDKREPYNTALSDFAEVSSCG